VVQHAKDPLVVQRIHPSFSAAPENGARLETELAENPDETLVSRILHQSILVVLAACRPSGALLPGSRFAGATPVVYLHGGPGSGCTSGIRRAFDPARHRAVLYDQRAAGRSTPHASEEGVDWASIDMDHHVADI
jgi:pimeloyl-ACP methyl ester carboxylesterase